uniref:Myosin N-terminal SH3-like domain-containing protein n=1 Tax=Ditylenchus dipsaci TaxID=166011 RepID=A0A915CSF4_9BILA
MNTMEKDPGWQFLRLSREKLLAEQNRPYDSKKNGYAAGEVTSTKGDTVVLTVKGAEKTVKKDVIQEMNPPKYEKTEDMSI